MNTMCGYDSKKNQKADEPQWYLTLQKVTNHGAIERTESLSR